MLFYQVELIKHGHDTCLEFMDFAASGDYAETQEMCIRDSVHPRQNVPRTRE